MADALWALALLCPSFYGILAGIPDFNPPFQLRLTMMIAGVLMTGWTVLLLWGVRKPIERKGVILITAFPVVFGMCIVSVIGYISGNGGGLWIIVKTAFLFITMILSWVLAGKVEKGIKRPTNESG